MNAFKPLQLVEGYLPIEDHGLIGDGTTAALVGRDGAISWMCVPRFDSPPLFCRILDVDRGGAFTVALEDLSESRQFYEEDTGVLVTEMRNASGMVRLTDALTFAVSPETELSQVLEQMAQEKYGCAVIRENDDEVLGIFTTVDACRLLARLLKEKQFATTPNRD